MAVRDIVIWPDPVLKTRAEEVASVGPELQPLLTDMVETMYAADGVGLAAPQVGQALRIFVVDTSGREGEEAGLLFFINPELVEAEGSTLYEEGCLSLPELVVEVERFTKVRMRALDREGQPFELEAEGLFAIALQHELDHLEGRLLVDRLSPLKRQLVRKKMLKLKQEREDEESAEAAT